VRFRIPANVKLSNYCRRDECCIENQMTKSALQPRSGRWDRPTSRRELRADARSLVLTDGRHRLETGAGVGRPANASLTGRPAGRHAAEKLTVTDDCSGLGAITRLSRGLLYCMPSRRETTPQKDLANSGGRGGPPMVATRTRSRADGDVHVVPAAAAEPRCCKLR